MDILVQPIKQGIIELLNDAELNKNECKFQAVSIAESCALRHRLCVLGFDHILRTVNLIQ